MPFPGLTVITACSRWGNLKDLRASLFQAQEWFDLRWIIVHDAPNIVSAFSTDPWVTEISHQNFESIAGASQKNIGLHYAKPDDWCYWLDDDNILHPQFPAVISCFIHNQPQAQGIIVGGPGRPAKPENVRVGGIDQAQYLVKRSLVGERRFVTGNYCHDGAMVVDLYRDNPHAFAFLDAELAYYNHLRT